VIPNSRNLVDTELTDLLDSGDHTVRISTDNLSEVRARWIAESSGFQLALNTEVDVSNLNIQARAGAPEVPLHIYCPKTGRKYDRGAILHMHGGGYIGGEAAVLEPIHRDLSSSMGCVLVSVDYRLAPETRFPGAIEDCYAGLLWLFEHARELGVDDQRIGVMGESAGGGLAAALTLLARDRSQVRPAFQHLTYPMLDDRTCVRDNPHPFTGEFIWTADNNSFAWSALLGASPGVGCVSPYAAAARASNLTGLPPMFLLTAALDLFLEENLEYARKLIRAGVSVELHVYPGAFHGFDHHPTARVALEARRVARAALRKFLGLREPPATPGEG
jgi:acetyl esterase/lipase